MLKGLCKNKGSCHVKWVTPFYILTSLCISDLLFINGLIIIALCISECRLNPALGMDRSCHMLTKNLIVAGFKEMLKDRPVHRIKVIDICEVTHISRKSFYNYFKDKDDLIEHIIHEDIIQPIRELVTQFPTDQFKSLPKMSTEKYYQRIYDRREFYSKFVTRQARYQFQDLLINEMTKINTEALVNSQIPKDEQSYMAYFFAASQSLLTIKWIQDGFIFTPREMMRFFFKWTLHAWWAAADRKIEWSYLDD